MTPAHLQPVSTTREATAVRSPHTTMKDRFCSPQLEKNPASSEDPAQPKISK